MIGTASNKLFRTLCDTMGRPELAADERFRSHRGRAANRREINGIVADRVRAQSCAQVLAALGPQGADLPCARVASPDELADDPQLRARGMVERHPHPQLGEIFLHGNPLRFSDAEPLLRPLAPALGAHNAEVFAEIGVGAEELVRLAGQGIV